MSTANMDFAQHREDFYDFPNVPFHKHLGIAFSRPHPNGPALVELPPSAPAVHDSGACSMAAVYTIGEVAAGIGVCDALVPFAADLGMRPLVLTSTVTFRPGAPVTGGIWAETHFVGDVDAAIARLRSVKKVRVQIDAVLRGQGGEVAGTTEAHFYVRLMEEARLQAMAARTPGMGPVTPPGRSTERSRDGT